MTNIVRTMGNEAVSIQDLRKAYKDVLALDGLDLSVPAGSIFGLLGPNGAGKSTTVKILITLSRPDSGTAIVVGIDVLDRPEAVRKSVGYVSQKSGSDGQATGIENLMLQARIHSLDRADAKRRSTLLIERLGLASYGDRLVKTWSGGMRRRLDIALALVHTPSVLFLDEPTTGLDPEVRADIWEEIRRLRDEEGVTILLTTHYLEEADQLADQIAIIDKGLVVAGGSPSQLKDGMQGDGLHLDLTSPDAIAVALNVLPGAGLRELVVDGRTIHARVDRGPEAIPKALSVLDYAGVRVAAVTMSRPSLDDVFLRHTGRSFTPTQQEGAA